VNFRAAVFLSLLGLLPMLGLFAPATATLQQKSPAPGSASPPAAKWINLPYVRQPKNGCGAAVISMVMRYWAAQQGEPPASAASATPDLHEIQSLLYVPAEKGIPASAMLNYFEHSGFRAYAFRGEWMDLEHHISLGRPLIVSLKASARGGPLHYAVVAGIDSQRDFIFLNDPARGKMLRISRQGFLGEWNPANNWTLLAVPAVGD
jgi:ABC-type bacteriocin/lantibiotic exporter with double-glycine peptidase domain